MRTLTIEGVVPTTFVDGRRQPPRTRKRRSWRWWTTASSDRDCTEAFPQFQQDIDRAFARLAQEPADATVRDPATGTTDRVPFGVSDLAYATRGLLYGDEALSLPEWFREAAQGRYDRFAQAYVNRARRMEGQIALGVHLGVYCAEDVPFVDWTAATQARDRHSDRHVSDRSVSRGLRGVAQRRRCRQVFANRSTARFPRC